MDGVTVLQVMPQTQLTLETTIGLICGIILAVALGAIIGIITEKQVICFTIMASSYLMGLASMWFGILPIEIYDTYYQIECNDIVTYSELVERYDIIEIKEDNTLIVKEKE